MILCLESKPRAQSSTWGEGARLFPEGPGTAPGQGHKLQQRKSWLDKEKILVGWGRTAAGPQELGTLHPWRPAVLEKQALSNLTGLYVSLAGTERRDLQVSLPA